MQALAIVIGNPDQTAELVARFEPVARVVVEPSTENGSAAQAFKVRGFRRPARWMPTE